ncbi:MAG TPA: hypothetical protein VGC30_02730, partial [Dokdonella sp.]
MKKMRIAALAAIALAPCAQAQTVYWQVVAAESSQIATPNLPQGVSRDFTDVRLGDVGAGLVGFRVSSPSASRGYWARSAQGVLQPYVQLDVAGALGPGRSGAESGDVFHDYESGWGSAGADGMRYFVGQAGAPGASSSGLSYGLWQWDGTRNVELARTLTDGPLGPNLGAGWVFPNSSSFVQGHLPTSAGTELFSARTTSPSGASGTATFKNVRGQGNQACLIVGSTDPQYSPGLGSGTFQSSPWAVATTPDGRYVGRFATSNGREGLWEICDGSPRPLVVDEETGARGPDIGIATAYFTSFYGNPLPGANGTLYFVASLRADSGST